MSTFLLPVPPEGAGTSDIEALDSYLDRLAAAHGIALSSFCRLLDDWWERDKPVDEASLGRYVSHIPKCGYGRDIEQLVKVLEAGTGFPGLASMTLLAFKQVSGRHVGEILRHVHHWCPACMQQWEQGGTPAYEKLLWRLKPISRCPIHRIRLENRCPHCGGGQTRRGDHPWFRCSQCFKPLCNDSSRWTIALTAAPGEKDLIDVLAFCASNPSYVFRRDSPHRFFHAIKHELGGERLSDSAGDYFHKRNIPTRKLVGSLLRIAQRFQTPLTDLLVDPKQAAAARPLNGMEPKPLNLHPANKAHDHLVRERVRQELEVALQQGLEGKSLAQICREVSVCHSCASRWFPLIVASLVKHQTELREKQRELDLARLDAITLDDLLTPEMQAIGWHKIPHVIARQWSVSIYIARKRVSALRRTAYPVERGSRKTKPR